MRLGAGRKHTVLAVGFRQRGKAVRRAAPFIYLIREEAGIKKLAAPRKFLKVTRPVSVTMADKHIALYPADELKVTYSISFDPLLRHQARHHDHRADLRRRDHAGPHFRLPQGSRDASQKPISRSGPFA